MWNIFNHLGQMSAVMDWDLDCRQTWTEQGQHSMHCENLQVLNFHRIVELASIYIVGSGVRPPPFFFYPTLFIKAPLILKIPDPHPFSNLYVSYIHFWCHGNVVDWHPHYWYITSLIFSLDLSIFSMLFCKYKCTTWKSEEPHPLL